jgi:hypothetical protein
LNLLNRRRAIGRRPKSWCAAARCPCCHVPPRLHNLGPAALCC